MKTIKGLRRLAKKLGVSFIVVDKQFYGKSARKGCHKQFETDKHYSIALDWMVKNYKRDGFTDFYLYI